MAIFDKVNIIKINDYTAGVVSISNALNDAAQCLTLMEKRLVFYCIAEVNSIKTKNQQANNFKIVVRDFADFFKMNTDSAYTDLRMVTIGIMKKQIEFSELDRNGKIIIKRRQWLSGCDYHQGEGWLTVKFSSDVAPHLTFLRSKFTSYRLEQASALRSLYSWRLLEKLMQFENDGKGWWAVEIEDFCRIMEAAPSMRADFGALRRRIIEPAMKELIEKDGWLIEYTPIKAGRKVISLRFDFKRNLQLALEF
jgi:plasmid replication initiation protein